MGDSLNTNDWWSKRASKRAACGRNGETDDMRVDGNHHEASHSTDTICVNRWVTPRHLLKSLEKYWKTCWFAMEKQGPQDSFDPVQCSHSHGSSWILSQKYAKTLSLCWLVYPFLSTIICIDISPLDTQCKHEYLHLTYKVGISI